jgi:type IV secretory pathway VirB4 component
MPTLMSRQIEGIGLGPDSIQIESRLLSVGDLLATTLIVTGYPAEVTPGWLDPLLTYPGRLDVSLHIEPVPPAVASERLRKQRARLESTRRSGQRHGRLEDPETEAAAEDAAELAWRVARGEGKLFRVGLYLTVYAADRQALADEVSAVRALAESMLLRCQPATWRALQGWTTCLPLGVDQLTGTRTLDTAALASCFPFSSPALPTADSQSIGSGVGEVLFGLDAAASGLVLWDRFAQDNHNSVTLARSGSGKSYLAKLEALRLLYQGVQIFVIDPENEYTRLAQAVGGTVIPLGQPGVRVNPLDLGADGAADQLTQRALFLHSFLAVLLGQAPSPAEKALLDSAILTAYRSAGLTLDPRTHTRPAPLLAQLADALSAGGADGEALAARLAPYTTGTHRQLFDGPTSQSTDSHLTVYSLRDVPEELKTAATMLTLDRIWQAVNDPRHRRPRLVIVDEAWLLMRDEHGAQFLYRMAKSFRKRWAGLSVITQDTPDLLATDLGKAVVANAATQILLRQAPQAIDAVTEAFRLSAGEAAYLLAADKGEALLCAGPGRRAAFTTVASGIEHQLITTDPAELADQTDPGRHR